MDPELIPTQVVTPAPPPEGGSGFRGLPTVEDTLPIDRFAGFPRVGDHVQHCKLVAELGRGASGLVYLAEQDELAQRPIVLKVTKDDSRGEHLRLARLQHTHVMPLYWVAELPRGLHVLAMPYLARTTLVRLLALLEGAPRAEWAGQRVADLLEGDLIEIAVPIAIHEHPAVELKASTWEQFIVRLGELLAETLAFIHRRGLVHLDLKPSNILVTPDGLPILLDLDIACQPIPAGAAEWPWLGGTWEYMSPEQRDAVLAIKADKPVPAAVDGRSDIFTLGLVMFEALGGETDADGKADFARFRKERPEVSPGLTAILEKCLDPNPWRRYPDGQTLAEELQHHARNEPLALVREPVVSQWRKWRRRRPWDLPVAAICAAFLVAAATVGWLVFRKAEDELQLAEAALIEGKDLQRQGLHTAAIRQFVSGKDRAADARGGHRLTGEFEARIRHSERMLRADELAHAVRWMRFYALLDRTPQRSLWVMEGAARKLWAGRALLIETPSGIVEPAFEQTLRERLQEFVLLWVPLHVQLSPPSHEAAARADADRILAEAEAVFGPTLAFDLAREHLGRPRERTHPPAAAWEHCAVAREDLRRGDPAAAEESVRAALALDPRGFVPQLHQGVVAMRRGDYDLAVQAFSFCCGQDPQAECFLLRAKALEARGDDDRAMEDCRQAIALNAELAAAYELRAGLWRRQGFSALADADEERARGFGE